VCNLSSTPHPDALCGPRVFHQIVPEILSEIKAAEA